MLRARTQEQPNAWWVKAVLESLAGETLFRSSLEGQDVVEEDVAATVAQVFSLVAWNALLCLEDQLLPRFLTISLWFVKYM